MVSSPTAVAVTPNCDSATYLPPAGESPATACGSPSTFLVSVTVPGDACGPSTVAPSAPVIARWGSTAVLGATSASLNVSLLAVTWQADESPCATDAGSH